MIQTSIQILNRSHTDTHTFTYAQPNLFRPSAACTNTYIHVHEHARIEQENDKIHLPSHAHSLIEKNTKFELLNASPLR